MKRVKQKSFQVALAILILIGAVVTARFLANLRKPVKPGEVKKIVPVVRVFTVGREKESLRIWEYAAVRPIKKIDLVAQVSGKIIQASEKFAVGGRFSEGEEIIRIDPKDYELALKLAESKVKQAESLLEKERAESEVSRREWMESEGTKKVPRLVARKPQVEAAKAELEAAKAQLKKAKLDLQRTIIKAPFDCIISAKFADVGQYVTPAKILGTAFYSGKVEIEVLLKQEDVQWINIPGLNIPASERGSDAVILFHVGGKEYQRSGRIVRWNNFLDEATRLVPVVVEVDKPYNILPPLAVGTFVRVGIEGRRGVSAFVIPSSALHDDENGNTVVWLVDKDSTLQFRKVKVAYRWRGKAYAVSGLKGGERLVVSSLNLVSSGMKVKAVAEDEDSSK